MPSAPIFGALQPELRRAIPAPGAMQPGRRDLGAGGPSAGQHLEGGPGEAQETSPGPAPTSRRVSRRPKAILALARARGKTTGAATPGRVGPSSVEVASLGMARSDDTEIESASSDDEPARQPAGLAGSGRGQWPGGQADPRVASPEARFPISGAGQSATPRLVLARAGGVQAEAARPPARAVGGLRGTGSQVDGAPGSRPGSAPQGYPSHHLGSLGIHRPESGPVGPAGRQDKGKGPARVLVPGEDPAPLPRDTAGRFKRTRRPAMQAPGNGASGSGLGDLPPPALPPGIVQPTGQGTAEPAPAPDHQMVAPGEDDAARLQRLQGELTAMRAQLAEARQSARPTNYREVRAAEDAVLAERRFNEQMDLARRESIMDQAERRAGAEGETQLLADIRADRMEQAARRVEAERVYLAEQAEYDQAVRESQDRRHGRADRATPMVDERDGRDYGNSRSGDTDNMSVSLARAPPSPDHRHGRGTAADRERAAATNDPAPGSQYRVLHKERLEREVSPPPRRDRVRQVPARAQVPQARPRVHHRVRRASTPPSSDLSGSGDADPPPRGPPCPVPPVPQGRGRRERDPTPPGGLPPGLQFSHDHRSPPPEPRSRHTREMDPSKIAQRPVRFDGTTREMRVETWLRTLANYLVLCEVPPRKWSALCEAFLTGQAAAGWQASHPDVRTQCTWDQISQWLITNFGEVNLVQAAGDKWHDYTIKSHKLTNHILVASGREIRRVAGDLGRPVPEWELIDRYLRAVRSHSDKGKDLEHILRRERDRPNTGLTTLEEVTKLAGLEAPDEGRAYPDHEGHDRAVAKKQGRHGGGSDQEGPDRGRSSGHGQGSYREKRGRPQSAGPGKRDRSVSRGDAHRGSGVRDDRRNGSSNGGGNGGGYGSGGGRGYGGGAPRGGGRGGGHFSGPPNRQDGGPPPGGYRVCGEHFASRRRANQCTYCAAPPINGEAPHTRFQCPLYLAGKPPKDHRPEASGH